MKVALIACLAISPLASADDRTPPVTCTWDSLDGCPRSDHVDADDYLFHHPDASWWLSGQVNSITQVQPGFHSPYQGANSFTSQDHFATSYVATVYAAYAVTHLLTIMVAGESAGGGGLSQALGIAGFTNLDVVRNPTLGPTPYLGRAIIQQTVPLDDHYITTTTAPFNVNHRVPAHRITVRAGKLSTVDTFDVNEVASDSHLQMMNWSLANNGSYDYAADTRGYTLGGSVEYAAPSFAVRYGLMLMPTVANGIDYDFGLRHARGEQLEVELHTPSATHPGTLRILGYLNHANMGNYALTNAEIREGILDPAETPSAIALTRAPNRTKYGIDINAYQSLPHDVRAFVRAGTSDGKNEAFAYTEIDNSLSAGADVTGAAWHRPDDRVALAAVSNGLSRDHRDYLALGGEGFLLGDGKLPHYGRETIVETYYTARAYRGVSPAIDIQLVANPGYNSDRGPAVVGSFRLHLEL